MFFDICHDTRVHFDVMTSAGVYRCGCGRKWYPVIPQVPSVGLRYMNTYWVEGWSWRRFWNSISVTRW